MDPISGSVSYLYTEYVCPFWDDVNGSLKNLSDMKTFFEGVGNIFDWMAHIGCHKKFAQNVSQHISHSKSVLSLPSFLTSLKDFYTSGIHWFYCVDPMSYANNREDFLQNTALSSFHFCDLLLAMDTCHIYSLKALKETVKTSFWSALGIVDGIELHHTLNKIGELKEDWDSLKAKEKSIRQHRLNHCYLTVAKTVSTLAMVSLSLISILFASVAHGFLFSPVVSLSLTSIWLTLAFTTHFYEKIIDRSEKIKIS